MENRTKTSVAEIIASPPPPYQQSDLLNTIAAAKVLDCKPSTLEIWRCNKRHAIRYYKVGRLVRYKRSDLEAWLASRTVAA